MDKPDESNIGKKLWKTNNALFSDCTLIGYGVPVHILVALESSAQNNGWHIIGSGSNLGLKQCKAVRYTLNIQRDEGHNANPCPGP